MARSILGSLPQYVSASVTQGSADAFATTRIETGISTAAQYAWMLDRVEFYLNPVAFAGTAGADSDIQIQLAQGAVPTAVLTPTDPNLICRSSFSIVAQGTPAALQMIPGEFTWTAPENFVIVDPSIHLLVDSSATTLSNVVYTRIWYWPVQVSEMDLLRMIALR